MKKKSVTRRLVKNLCMLGLALAVFLSSVVTFPQEAEAASATVILFGLDEYKEVKDITIPKGEEFFICLKKGKNTYDDVKIKYSKKGIVTDEDNYFLAKKQGKTKITLSYKKIKASVTVRVVEKFNMKLKSVKKEGNYLAVKVTNKMSKNVKYDTTSAIHYDDGDDIKKTKLKKAVTIKPGKTGTIYVKLDKEYDDVGVKTHIFKIIIVLFKATQMHTGIRIFYCI